MTAASISSFIFFRSIAIGSSLPSRSSASIHLNSVLGNCTFFAAAASANQNTRPGLRRGENFISDVGIDGNQWRNVRSGPDAGTWKTVFGVVEDAGERVLFALAGDDECASESMVQDLIPGEVSAIARCPNRNVNSTHVKVIRRLGGLGLSSTSATQRSPSMSNS